jgi:hypothetical protein
MSRLPETIFEKSRREFVKTKKATPRSTTITKVKKTPVTKAPAAATTHSRVTLRQKAPAYSPQDIANRAYFLSLERGGSPDENWKQAEAEFQAGLWR